MSHRSIFLCVVLVSACEDVDENKGNINNQNMPDGAMNDGATKAETGACPMEFEPISVTSSMYFGEWLIDDAASNATCPNGTTISLGPGDGLAPPPNPGGTGPCVRPAVFFNVKPSKVKDCAPDAYCPTATGGFGFFIDALNKGAPAPEFNDEPLWQNSDGTWIRVPGQGVVATTANGGTINYFGKDYKRTNITGSCIQQ